LCLGYFKINMTPYEVFSLFHSLKLHFTQDTYNFFKYQGKIKISIDAFENRKDKWHFAKLSRKFSNKEDCIDYIVANLVENDKIWVGNLLEESSEIFYKQRQKVLQSLSYTFENDCKLIFEDCKNPNEVLKVIDGEHPVLLKKTMRKEIQIESFVVLDKILNFTKSWSNKIEDTILWPEYKKKIYKYGDFVNIEPTKYKLILKKVLNVN